MAKAPMVALKADPSYTAGDGRRTAGRGHGVQAGEQEAGAGESLAADAAAASADGGRSVATRPCDVRSSKRKV